MSISAVSASYWNSWSGGESENSSSLGTCSCHPRWKGRPALTTGRQDCSLACPTLPATGWRFHLLLGAFKWLFPPGWMRHFSSSKAEIKPKSLLFFFAGSNPNTNYLHSRTIELHWHGRKRFSYFSGYFRMLSRYVYACVHKKGQS